MSDFFSILAFAALPGIGNFVGGLLAEFLPLRERTLGYALHLAAGIVLAVVGVELLPEALEAGTPWIIVLALIGGGLFFIGLEKTVHYVQGRFSRGGTSEAKSADSSGKWQIYIGVCIDLFTDGIMIGAGATLSPGLALLLALGQLPADVPEGFATIATFKEQKVPRRQRLLLSASLMLPILLGATIGYWAVRGSSDLVKASLLAFTAGILLSVAVEEMLTQAHAKEDTGWSTALLVSGFGLFILLSSYLE